MVEATIPDPDDDIKDDNHAVADHVSHYVHSINRNILKDLPLLAETRIF